MVISDYLFELIDNTLFQCPWCCSPYPDLTPSVSTAGMPAYTGIQMYMLPAATVHMMQPLLTAATVCYVIECYQTSFAFNANPMYYLGMLM